MEIICVLELNKRIRRREECPSVSSSYCMHSIEYTAIRTYNGVFTQVLPQEYVLSFQAKLLAILVHPSLELPLAIGNCCLPAG